MNFQNELQALIDRAISEGVHREEIESELELALEGVRSDRQTLGED